MDFVIRTRNGSVITHAIETKWITDSRDFKQEIIDDLVRLELIHVANRDIQRWLLLAGRYSQLKSSIFDIMGNADTGLPRTEVFENILSQTVGDRLTVSIRDSVLPCRRLWVSAGKTMNELDVELPISLTTTLAAKYPDDLVDSSCACFVWRVGRVGRRTEFTFE